MERLEEITVWLCEECGYWQRGQGLGLHAVPKESGKLGTHPLRPVRFVRYLTAAEEQEGAE